MTESHPTPRKNRNWLPCGCLLGMFLSCILLPVAAFVGWSFRASRQVETQFARIRQAGLPTKAAEMHSFYRIEAGVEDATDLYIAAQDEFSGAAFEADCRNLPIVGLSEIEIPPPGQPWSERQAVEEFLAEYDDGLQALHAAVEKGGAAQFPLAFEDGFAMLLPDVQEMRTCSRMLSLEAHVKAHQGDPDGAAKSIVALATVGRSLENQPILISQLVHFAMHGIAVDMTKKLLPHVQFSDEDLRRFQVAFRRREFKTGLAHAMIGERVMGAEAFKDPAAALGNDLPSPALKMVRGSNEDLALYLKIQADVHEAVQLDYPETFGAVEDAFAELQEKIGAPLGRMRYAMTGMTLPAIEACVDAAARADGSSRCIDAAIAVELFRRRAGKLPASLDDLVPNYLNVVPMDPYDGQPVRYLIKDDCYLIYTCGRNRVDDGGVEDKQQTDVVIRIDLNKADTPQEAKTVPPKTVTGEPGPVGASNETPE